MKQHMSNNDNSNINNKKQQQLQQQLQLQQQQQQQQQQQLQNNKHHHQQQQQLLQKLQQVQQWQQPEEIAFIVWLGYNVVQNHPSSSSSAFLFWAVALFKPPISLFPSCLGMDDKKAFFQELTQVGLPSVDTILAKLTQEQFKHSY